jgi:hypothetical protein
MLSVSLFEIEQPITSFCGFMLRSHLSRWEQKKVAVIPPFDIFRTVDGQWLWVASAPTLDTAKKRVNALMATLPTEYMISSHVTRKRISLKPGDSDWSEVFGPRTA